VKEAGLESGGAQAARLAAAQAVVQAGAQAAARAGAQGGVHAGAQGPGRHARRTPVPRHRLRHDEFEEVETEVRGERAVARRVVTQTPLDRYLRRGLIDRRQHDAGQALARDWHYARMTRSLRRSRVGNRLHGGRGHRVRHRPDSPGAETIGRDMIAEASKVAAALARIEAKLDGHIEHSREWRDRTDGAIADLADRVHRLDQLKNRGIGLLAGVAIAGGAAGSFAASRLKTLLGLG